MLRCRLQSDSTTMYKIPLDNPASLMSKHQPEVAFCHCKACVPLQDAQKDNLAVLSLDEGDKIQKKITPWKDMLENDELQPQNRKPANPNLILVASLIDRPPNLVIYVTKISLQTETKTLHGLFWL